MSTGWPAVRAQCADLGISFRYWQPDVGRLILAKRVDGKYAATIGGTGLSMPRQVGKTFLVAAIIFALCLRRPGLTVIWTAHVLSTAEETFGKLQVFAKRRRIAPHIERVFTGSGDEEIRFRNGSRILVGARERGFGRGLDEIDVLIFDEAQRLGDAALDDMVPATNQSRQETGALLLYMGTPPRPGDKGEPFSRMRAEALSGEDEDTGWVEFGADPDFTPTPPPAPLTAADWAQVTKANPSYPQDTPREAILRMRKKLGGLDSFLREGLGIWDADVTRDGLPLDKWADASDPVSEIAGVPVLAVAMTPDLSTVTLGACGRRDDDDWHVGIVEHGAAGEWFVPRVAEVAAEYGAEVWLHPGHPAGSLLADLQRVGVRVQTMNGTDYAQACGSLYRFVVDGSLHYRPPQPELDAAVRLATQKRSGETWKWAGEGISALVAVTQALHGAQAGPSVYEDGDLLVIGSI